MKLYDGLITFENNIHFVLTNITEIYFNKGVEIEEFKDDLYHTFCQSLSRV